MYNILEYKFSKRGACSIDQTDDETPILKVTNLQNKNFAGIYIPLQVKVRNSYVIEIEGGWEQGSGVANIWIGDINNKNLYYGQKKLPKGEIVNVVSVFNVGNTRRIKIGVLFDGASIGSTFLLKRIACIQKKNGRNLIEVNAFTRKDKNEDKEIFANLTAIIKEELLNGSIQSFDIYDDQFQKEQYGYRDV